MPKVKSVERKRKRAEYAKEKAEIEERQSNFANYTTSTLAASTTTSTLAAVTRCLIITYVWLLSNKLSYDMKFVAL